MAIETDVSELRERQKAKTRKNFLIKLFAVLAVVLIVVIAVFTKDKWYPRLDGILSKTPSVTTLENSENAVLAEGLFPVSIEGGSEYQLRAMDNYFAVLDDSRFLVYSTDGELVTEKQHTYANPILTVSNKKALIYDLGGNSFSLESKYKTVYEKTCDDTILLAELSSNDLVAVVTKSEKYLAQLDVYDTGGRRILTYKSHDSRITGVTFLNDNSGCVITTLGAEGGDIRSGLIRLNFDSEEEIWKTANSSCLAADTEIDENGSIVVIGDTKCTYFDDVGNVIAEHEYTDTILDYTCSPKLTAILLENADIRRYELLIISSGDINNPHTITLPEEARHISAAGSMIYVLTNSGIYTYNELGQEMSGVKLFDSYDNFCKIGSYFFLMGYDEINRISFS